MMEKISLAKKRECLKRALEVVESLLEKSVSEEYLLEVLSLIRRSEYKDVNQERAILKLCGYPLCDKSLDQVKPQKYHISLTRKKIYDITERKMFCSDFCYGASKYLEEQLLTTAVWSGDELGEIKFLSSKCS